MLVGHWLAAGVVTCRDVCHVRGARTNSVELAVTWPPPSCTIGQTPAKVNRGGELSRYLRSSLTELVNTEYV